MSTPGHRPTNRTRKPPDRPSPTREAPVWAYPEGLVICPGCGVGFAPVRTSHLVCSSACRMRTRRDGDGAPLPLRRRREDHPRAAAEPRQGSGAPA